MKAKKTYLFCIGLTLLAITLLVSCGKEESFEVLLPPGSVAAQGTLKDENGNCMPAKIVGDWHNGITPRDSNYVELQVNVTQPGYYKITTPALNGVTFSSDSGIFVNKGLQTVILKPAGRFIDPVLSEFSVSFDSSTCDFVINVQDSTGTNLGKKATGSVKDKAGNCITTTFKGIFYTGIALTDTVYAETYIDVFTPGEYDIVTPAVNGIYFAASGYFASAGPQKIRLQAFGVPLATGNFEFVKSLDESICGFSIQVLDGKDVTPPLSEFSWQFKVNGKLHGGNLDQPAEVETNSVAGFTLTSVTVNSVSANSESFSLILSNAAGGTMATTYSAGATQKTVLFSFTGAEGFLNTVPPADFTAVVNTFDTNKKIIQGTFSGNAADPGNQLFRITEGRFKAKLP